MKWLINLAVMAVAALVPCLIAEGALRVMAPDGLPIYEQSADFPGAFVATCHSGVTLAAAHALRYAEFVAAGSLPAELARFTNKRFNVQNT